MIDLDALEEAALSALDTRRDLMEQNAWPVGLNVSVTNDPDEVLALVRVVRAALVCDSRLSSAMAMHWSYDEFHAALIPFRTTTIGGDA